MHNSLFGSLLTAHCSKLIAHSSPLTALSSFATSFVSLATRLPYKYCGVLRLAVILSQKFFINPQKIKRR